MDVHIESDKNSLGVKAATHAAKLLQETLRNREEANLILATGASQFEMLQELVRHKLDWKRVNCFHLDEYVGLPQTHPASFRRYLKERFCDHVAGLKAFHWVNGDCPEPAAECVRLGKIIRQHPIDVACVGIGENGHLAFNDPPADFETEDPYLVVELDEACRRQQMGEGWFPSLEAVPTRAISMSIRQIMKAASIVCTVPDRRKARALQAAVEGPVSPEVPASILQQHPHTTLVLDIASASLLSKS
jgi:glucosamine-6-phosphate deaminase